jgi:serine/threonine protein kinase
MHENIVYLEEVIFEDRSIYMVFEYTEHDLLVRFADKNIIYMLILYQ